MAKTIIKHFISAINMYNIIVQTAIAKIKHKQTIVCSCTTMSKSSTGIVYIIEAIPKCHIRTMAPHIQYIVIIRPLLTANLETSSCINVT